MLNKKISDIVKPISHELKVFERLLKGMVKYDNALLNPDLINFLFSNQKRLRPIFVFLFSKILNIKDTKTVQKIALALELIHSASLIHDDIIDETQIRRNQETFHNKFNTKIAVLLGDLLLSKALTVLSKTNSEIIEIFSKKIKDTILGEIEQNLNLYRVTSENEYIKKTYSKTGNLFMAGLEALFTLQEINSDIKENLKIFLINYSIAFQINNDIKDIKHDEENGNYTLVMLYFLMENSIDEFNEISIDKYVLMAKEKKNIYKKFAIEFLNTVENTVYKKSFLDLCDLTL